MQGTVLEVRDGTVPARSAQSDGLLQLRQGLQGRAIAMSNISASRCAWSEFWID
jgi:hypothetical protein